MPSTAVTAGLATVGGLAAAALIAWPVAIWWEVRDLLAPNAVAQRFPRARGRAQAPPPPLPLCLSGGHLNRAHVVVLLNIQVRKCEKPKFTVLRTLGKRAEVSNPSAWASLLCCALVRNQPTCSPPPPQTRCACTHPTWWPR